jgi:uncharacterized membrane protein YbhN (UPF0104 family)
LYFLDRSTNPVRRVEHLVAATFAMALLAAVIDPTPEGGGLPESGFRRAFASGGKPPFGAAL